MDYIIITIVKLKYKARLKIHTGNKRSILLLPLNARLYFKNLIGTNALAYFAESVSDGG
jgi:hypothetical protein